MRVYLDLAAGLNFLVDFLLILGTNRLSGFPPGWGRSALAAAFGGVYTLICLLPGLRFLGNMLWRTVSLAAMAVIAFGFDSDAIRRGAVFVLLAMALGGVADALGQGSILTLIIAASGIWLLCRFSFRGQFGRRTYIPVELRWNGRTMKLLALYDTGNTLRDPITGEGVLVAGADVAYELLGLTPRQLRDPAEAAGEIPGLRLIPYHSVGQPAGLLPALRIPNAKIGGKRRNPLVAFAPETLARGEVYRMLAGGTI